MTATQANEARDDQLSTLLSRYRALSALFAAVIGMFVFGGILHLVAGPEDTLMQETAGLLGATALIFLLCLALVGALWGALIVTNR